MSTRSPEMLQALTCLCVCLPTQTRWEPVRSLSPGPRTERVPCGGSPHGAKWAGLLDSGTTCGRPLGLEGTKGRGSLLPAVAGVAAAERDVLHLEEVAAALELEERQQKSAKLTGGPACQTRLI